MRVYILGDDIFSLFITNDDIHPRIGGSYGDWQDSGLFQKRTYGNSISPNIGFRASGLGDGSVVWYGNVTGETVTGRGGCLLHGGMFAMETDDNRITSTALHRGFRASGLGDDTIHMSVPSMDEYSQCIGSCGAGYFFSIDTGLFHKDLNWSNNKIFEYTGFRALVMMSLMQA